MIVPILTTALVPYKWIKALALSCVTLPADKLDVLPIRLARPLIPVFSVAFELEDRESWCLLWINSSLNHFYKAILAWP
jgi:hypothetical protein